MINQKAYLNPKLFDEDIEYQKTALTDGHLRVSRGFNSLSSTSFGALTKSEKSDLSSKTIITYLVLNVNCRPRYVDPRGIEPPRAYLRGRPPTWRAH